MTELSFVLSVRNPGVSLRAKKAASVGYVVQCSSQSCSEIRYRAAKPGIAMRLIGLRKSAPAQAVNVRLGKRRKQTAQIHCQNVRFLYNIQSD